MKHTSNPCVATCADGSKCGRRAKLPDQLCSIHKATALGQTVGKPFQTAQLTPRERVEKLLNDSDPTVRLRALDMWIRHFESRESDNGHRDVITFLTDEEKAALREAINWTHLILEAVFQRQPDLGVPESHENWRRQQAHDAHQATVPTAPVVMTEPFVAQPQASDGPDGAVEERKSDKSQPPLDMPFDPPVDGQLTLVQMQRQYPEFDVTETTPGQFTMTEKAR